jgi:predicted PurR-regulated permease PerM
MKLENSYLLRCFLVISTWCLVVLVLVVGKPVLAPFALSCILAFVLTPIVRYLETRGFPRVAAVMCTVIVVVSIFIGLSVAFVSQLGQLAAEMPKYERELETKMSKLQELGSLVPDRVWSMAEHATALSDGEEGEGEDLQNTAPEDTVEPENAIAVPTPARVTAPYALELFPGNQRERVVLVERPRSRSQPWLRLLPSVVGPLIEPLATLAIVVVLAVFMMIGRDDLRNRILAILGRAKLTRTTQLLGDSSSRLGRFLLGLLAVNFGFAVTFAVGLYFIGVPYAALWGSVSFFFRFIPYIGSATSMLLPLGVAIMTVPGWFAPIGVIVWYSLLEFSSGNFLEPWLFGKSVGMNPLAIIVALMFWTWAWGMVGLLLATPLSLTLVTLGRHFHGFEWSNLLLSDSRPLPHHISFFQRMLANDKVELQAILLSAQKKFGAAYAMQRLVLRALSHADRELGRGAIRREDHAQVEAIASDMSEKIVSQVELEKSQAAELDALEHRSDEDAGQREPSLDPLLPPVRKLRVMTFSLGDRRGREALKVLMAGRDQIEIVSQSAAPTPAIARQCVDELVDLVVISATATVSRELLEAACRTLRRCGYHGWIAVGWWRVRVLAEPIRRSLKDSGADYVTYRMKAMNRMINYAENAHEKNDKPVATVVAIEATSIAIDAV